MPSVSAILITHNEAANLRDCLASVAWCDEIVIVDNGSTDGTHAIAEEFGARLIITPDWPGFGPQKQRALAAATGDWIFSIDADERLTEAGTAEIRAAIASGTHAGYAVPRSSLFVSRFMRHSGWTPDYVLRLARRDAAKFSDHLVHERLLVAGSLGQLRTPLVHLSYPDFESVLVKLNRYSSAGAREAHARGKRASLASAIGHGAWTFFRTYVLKRGFLDGAEGLMLAISNAEASYYKYVKLRELTRKTDPSRH